MAFAMNDPVPNDSPPAPPALGSRIFFPVHDNLVRCAIFAGIFAAGITLFLANWYWQSSAWQVADVSGDQPVPFSHKHHVSQLGIDCRFCHTAVTDSSFAGVPPTETCMTCHSQIWTQAAVLKPVRVSAEMGVPIAWHRVTNIPNYVYFNHSAHVTRGVACISCHGRVDQMQLTYEPQQMTMGWCLNCHRNPEANLVPLSQVTKPAPDLHPAKWADWEDSPLPLTDLQKKHLTDCSACHR